MNSQNLTLYVGSYTSDLGFVNGKGRGIALYSLDQVTGRMTLVSETGADNPSFLAFHPNGKFLYAVNESTPFGSPPDNAISAFAISEDGSLRLLNQQASLGGAPCFIGVEPGGRFALTANYVGGNFVMYPIGADGRLVEASHNAVNLAKDTRQTPHAHSITVAPGGKYALACDLGLDRVFVYALDVTDGKIVLQGEAVLPPGAGPRHLAFHPDGDFVYVINELNATLTGFAWNAAAGSLAEIETVPTLPAGYNGKLSCADIHIHPNGRFLYGSNRGHDSIVIFEIDPRSERLTTLGHEPTRGNTPRNFALTPDGGLLLAANQDSDSVVVFQVNPDTGRLAYLATNNIPTPVCLLFF